VTSVTPFSARALDRGFAGALVGLARHARAELTPPQGAERISDVREELERRLLDRFLERVRQQPFANESEREERLRSVQNRIVTSKRFARTEAMLSSLPVTRTLSSRKRCCQRFIFENSIVHYACSIRMGCISTGRSCTWPANRKRLICS